MSLGITEIVVLLVILAVIVLAIRWVVTTLATRR